MNKHMITTQEVMDYLGKESWEQIAASWGGTSHKKLEQNNVTKIFKVTDHNTVVFQGLSIDRAVEAYNKAD